MKFQRKFNCFMSNITAKRVSGRCNNAARKTNVIFKNVCFYINFVFLIVRSVLQVHVDVDVDVT